MLITYFLLEIAICFLFFDGLHLQIIENISPKVSVENSSAQWAMFFLKIQW